MSASSTGSVDGKTLVTHEMQTRDRADVHQLSDWIDREIANGATETELHDTMTKLRTGESRWKNEKPTRPAANAPWFARAHVLPRVSCRSRP